MLMFFQPYRFGAVVGAALAGAALPLLFLIGSLDQIHAFVFSELFLLIPKCSTWNLSLYLGLCFGSGRDAGGHVGP